MAGNYKYLLLYLLILMLFSACIRYDNHISETRNLEQDSLLKDSIALEFSDVFTPQTEASRIYQQRLIKLIGEPAYSEAKEGKNWLSLGKNEEYIWVLFYDKKQIVYGKSFSIIMLNTTDDILYTAIVDSNAEVDYYREKGKIPLVLTKEINELLNI